MLKDNSSGKADLQKIAEYLNDTLVDKMKSKDWDFGIYFEFNENYCAKWIEYCGMVIVNSENDDLYDDVEEEFLLSSKHEMKTGTEKVLKLIMDELENINLQIEYSRRSVMTVLTEEVIKNNDNRTTN